MKVLAAVLTGALVVAAPGRDPARASDREVSILARPMVIGASISAGFAAGKDLSQVLDAMLGRDHGSIETAFSMLFWREPIETARSQAALALESEPTLVIAIDFLFWLACGGRDLDGEPVTGGAQRLALLKHGLELLEPLPCPIVLGDLPHYRKDLSRMIAPATMPTPELLDELNRELRRWSERRGDVIVLPLAREIETAQDDAETVVGGWACREGRTRGLLQPDGIHPTLEGLVWIVHVMATEMVAREWIEKVETDLPRILDELAGGDPPSDGSTARFESTRDGEER